MSKVMGIYVKFTKTTHHVTGLWLQIPKIFIFRLILEIGSRTKKLLQPKNKLGGGGVEPPSAYRVNILTWFYIFGF